ncbi:RNA polymerase sigma factor [Alkalicoccobacillus gibsonii]|uniref:RNA polymerase sigma factor n=1 Tax=Alkalicoccobacillus gibsonii TaxID=79881 RepID=UPI003F7BF473
MIAYQNGDEIALERIFERYRDPLYRFLYRYSKDEQLSIDIVQDTFVTLQTKKRHFDQSKGQLKAYLFQIAYRLMITKLNRRKKWRNILPFLIPLDKQEVSNVDRLTIQAAIDTLPELQRAVILLVYYHDLKQDEVANILKIPVGTVKSRLHTAIKGLKERLEEDYDGKGPF